MFTHLRINETNERGALMLEAIALLGLMTMMSPMVVRQTADRTAEMEEVTIAGQMKDLRDALNNYIETKYNSWYGELHSSQLSHTYTINAQELSVYLPTSAIDVVHGDGETPDVYSFRGNKLADDFDISVKADCMEMRLTNGATCAPGTCYILDNGVVSSPNPSSSIVCSRYKMSGIILSNKGEDEIDDRRAARIASMIGADGGYTRTTRVVDALGEDEDSPERRKILGSQGIWEGDTEEYFGEEFENPAGRIAVTTSYSSGISGDYLYRKQVNGLPEANSMFTDLDMGGNGTCSGNTGCNRINNAGGLEVIDGQILIRSQNNAATGDDQTVGNPSASDYAKIALGLAQSHIKTEASVTLEAGGEAETYLRMSKDGYSVALGTNGADGQISINASGADSQINILRGTDRSLNLNDDGVFATASTSAISLQNNEAQISLNGGTELFDIQSSAAKIMLSNGEGVFSIQSNAEAGAEISVGNGRHLLSIKDDDVRLSMAGDTGFLKFDGNRAHLKYGNSDMDMRSDVITLNAGTNVQTLLDNTNGATTTVGAADFSLTEAEFSANLANNASFSLTDDTFSTNLNTGQRFTFTDEGLKLFNDSGDTPTIQLNVASGRISASYFQPNQIVLENGNLGGPVRTRAHLNVDEATGKTTIDEVDVSDNNDASVTIDYRGYRTYSNDTSYIGDPDAAVNAEDAHTQHPYKFHKDEDARYNRFRVDPAFTSVMNDIKLTSRGGARLSEALPNYILKGIYVLSNTYSAGGWPCGWEDEEGNRISIRNTCDFDMPHYRLTEIGVSEGGFEFNCLENVVSHPILRGGGWCNDHLDPDADLAANPPILPDKGKEWVEFSYNSYMCSDDPDNAGIDGGSCNSEKRYRPDQYVECDGTCWAHPFMGKVPAPGRSVDILVRNENVANTYATPSYHTDTIYAQDEGVCPDGYQAVLTVTPNKFDVGKFLAHDETAGVAGANIRYNFGYLNYRDEDNRSAVSLQQSGTGLAIHTESEIDEYGQIKGWKIAMGTVTPTYDGGYVWNMGGVYTDSWQAVAHTYCYFNPNRFTMPNMRFKKMHEGDAKEKHGLAEDSDDGENVILTPMHNPGIPTE